MSRESSYRLVRLYLLVHESNWADRILHALKESAEITGTALATYSVNYGPSQAFNEQSLARELGRYTLSDFESLSAEERGAIGLHMTPAFRYLNVADVYDYGFAFRSTANFTEQFADLVTRAQEVGEILYGYGRVLDDSFTPGSEARITRTLFGGSKTKTTDPVAEWWENPASIRDGAAKGLYPLNLLSDRRGERQLPVPMLHPVRLRNCTLIELSPADLDVAKSDGSIGPYVRKDKE